MTERVTLELAFVLHSRPYSNTSLLLELFTLSHGRMSALARSARGPTSRYRGILQGFAPLLVSWSGRTELKSLGHAELNGMSYQLNGQALLCGFYINELLLRLLQREDPYPQLFSDYQQVLKGLESSKELLVHLRLFEKRLLERLGYALPLTRDAQTGNPIEATAHYQYLPERGFVRSEQQESNYLFHGEHLLALHHETLMTEECLLAVKRLMRLVYSRHLGAKPIKSRELMV